MAFTEVMQSYLLKKLRMCMFPRNAEVIGNTDEDNLTYEDDLKYENNLKYED